MQAAELWAGFSQSSLCPLILHTLKSDTITMILNCEQKTAKHISCSLDATDQYVLSEHRCVWGPAQPGWSLATWYPFELELPSPGKCSNGLWFGLPHPHPCHCCFCCCLCGFPELSACQQQFWLVCEERTTVFLASGEANCNKILFFSAAFLKNSPYCSEHRQKRLECPTEVPATYLCTVFLPHVWTLVFTES